MQKKITLPNGEYLVVSVPKGEGIHNVKLETGFNKEVVDYEIIGLASQITEQQAVLICYKIEGGWLNFLTPSSIIQCKTALESFHSWLKANQIYFENPYGNEPRSYSEVMYGISADELMDNLKQWQEAEANKIEEAIILKLIK